MIDYQLVIEKPEELSFYQNLRVKIIDYLDQNQKTTLQGIVKNVEGSDRRTLRLLDQMVKSGEIDFEYPYFVCKSKEAFEITIDDVRCPNCEAKMVVFGGLLEDIYKKVKLIFVNKPVPTFVFDQRPVNAETTTRRAAYAILRGDLKGKEIVIIGDDDLTSIAIAMTKLPKRVHVFDIDQRLLDYIDQISKEYNLGITTECRDLTKGVGEEHFGKYDVFMTDPTPTEKPFTIFTNIGIDLTRTNGIGYISINPSHSPKLLSIQKVMSDMNLLITDSIPYFTQYDFIEHTYKPNDKVLLKKYAAEESKISFYEYLIRVEKTETTKKVKIDFDMEDIIGKATKRVLDDPSKDPVLSGSGKDFEYVKKMADLLVSSIKK